MKRAQRRYAAIFGAAAVVLPVAGCGDDNKSDDTTAASDATTSAPPESGSADAGSPIDNINPPSGSTEINSSDIDGGVFQRYSTDESAKSVISSYESQFKQAGWKILKEGGSGGGWGPYGGSGEGLTAQMGDTYADVQAGGEKGGTTYFEVCAGTGTREACDNESDDQNNSTNSGGSQTQNNNDDNNSKSGGS